MSDFLPLTPERVTRILRDWKQGDCVVSDDLGFIHRFEPTCPLSPAACSVEEEDVDVVEDLVPGLCVVSQICDIVRNAEDQPYIEVVPLVEVGTVVLEEIRKARRPAYAFVPGVAHRSLVADLSRVMTVEKAVAAKWKRIAGCDEPQRIKFQHAVARKRRRFAFADEFVRCTRKLQERLKTKHTKKSEEGEALRSLAEIRVCAEPSWDSDSVKLFFRFIRGESQEAPGDIGWDEHLQGWLKLVKPSGRFARVEGDVVTLQDMSAQEYVDTVPLDLDNLSHE